MVEGPRGISNQEFWTLVTTIVFVASLLKFASQPDLTERNKQEMGRISYVILYALARKYFSGILNTEFFL